MTESPVKSGQNEAYHWTRDIYYAKCYGRGGGVVAGDKNEELGEKMKKEKEKGRKITLKRGKMP